LASSEALAASTRNMLAAFSARVCTSSDSLKPPPPKPLPC
jgi:hypothetical protein